MNRCQNIPEQLGKKADVHPPYLLSARTKFFHRLLCHTRANMKVCAGHQSQKIDEFGAHVLEVKWKIEGCGLFFERKALRSTLGLTELEHRAGTGSWISGGITKREPIKVCAE